MEHDSFVPTPVSRMLAALRTPSVVTASLPGWQPDADAGAEPRGRLRLRVGGSTITYRATFHLAGSGPAFTLQGEGAEVRGTGTVKVTAEVAVAAARLPEPGTTLAWRGSGEVDGRLASYEDEVVDAAVRRLLDRFAAQLAENAPEDANEGENEGGGGADAGPGPAGSADDDGAAPVAGTPPEDAPEQEPAAAGAPAGAEAEAPAADDADGTVDAPAADTAKAGADAPSESGAETGDEPDVVDDLGEPSPEAEEFELVEVEVEVPESAAALDDLVPPAEAAHARRTMIGRSAEEVDHAPPRGRYAPVPAPDAGSGAAALRWAAPAAAALVASAVVVGRVLRRRR